MSKSSGRTVNDATELPGALKLPVPEDIKKEYNIMIRGILIFLSGAMFGGMIGFLTFCLVAGIQLKNDKKCKKRSNKEEQADA